MSDTIIRTYLNGIEQHSKRGIATEHTYRGTLQKLLEDIGTGISAINEPKRIECGAPDFLVEHTSGSANLTIGYVEAKDINVSLDTVEEGEQLSSYRRALNNLILTNYLEFRWYVNGNKQKSARLATLSSNGSLILEKGGVNNVEDLLQTFFEHTFEPIRKPQELAKRMARLTHMIRDIIIDTFHTKLASNNLKDLYTAFQETLLPDLNETVFADMFAQTLAYGLFAARYNHKGNKPFRREDAIREIPRTNPFLRKLFNTIAGPDLDDEPFVGFVDELAQILAYTDMDVVLADFGKRTWQEDPIVHFYETFLAQYDPELKQLRGVYYTPDPVVSYIVRSVDTLLRTHFDCADGLADTETIPYSSIDADGKEQIKHTPRVLLLDPATGSATFPYHVIAHIRETYRQMGNAGMWSSYVREHLLPRLFGFELLMAPYTMAHLKLSMQLAAFDLPEEERSTWAYDFQTNERLAIYMTNALDEALKKSEVMFGHYISEEANEAVSVKNGYPVMVIMGNPPYAGHSANLSRKKVIDHRTNKAKWVTTSIGNLLQDYYYVDGKKLQDRNTKWLQDDYVKFIRFAQWRIEKTGYGILAFITNHGYLDNRTFRGMRQSLIRSFDEIYVLNLHGNSNKKERSPDGTKDENVFDIQQGVAIGIFVKKKNQRTDHQTAVYHADLWGPRAKYERTGQEQQLVGGKYHWLAQNDVSTVKWTQVKPVSPSYKFVPQDTSLQPEFNSNWLLSEALTTNNVGVVTGQNANTIAFSTLEAEKLADEKELAHNVIKPFLFHPFDIRHILYAKEVVTRTRPGIMHHILKGENIGLIATSQTQDTWGVLVTNQIIAHKSLATYDISTLFPLYLYPKSGENLFAEDKRHPNFATPFIKAIAAKLNIQFIPEGKGNLDEYFGPEDILDYIYAVLYSPAYRERYEEFLKSEFPRIPLTSNSTLFRTLCAYGSRLVELHLMQKFGTPSIKYPSSGDDIITKINYIYSEATPEKSRIWINNKQYFEGIQPETWEFHIGGYQVCKQWLSDRQKQHLSFTDIQHYQRTVAALAETITLMEQIDSIIEKHGGWPLQ
jgi:hypothetical protein